MKRQIHAYRGHERDRGRGPQHQARPRRHPRDRVLRADPAADRRRTSSGAARPPDARHAGDAGRRRLDRRRSPARPRGGLPVPALGRAPAADGRRRADPHAAGRSRRPRPVRPLPRARRPRRVRVVLLQHLRKVQRALRPAVRGRAGAGGAAPRPRLRTRGGRAARPSTSSTRWASSARPRFRPRCAAGSRATIARSGTRRHATSSPN